MKAKIKISKDNFLFTFLILIFAAILGFRFLFLDFGLPYVYQGDEPELVEYSLKYAVNTKKFFEGDFLFFKPFSFVYGTFPTYFNTALLIPFLKYTQFFDLSQDRYYIYLYLRVIYAIFSICSCIGVYFLAKEILKEKTLALASAILFSLSYSFLWLSKYLNNDSLIVLFTIWCLYFYLLYQKRGEKKNLYFAIFFLALGISTKITFSIIAIYPFTILLLNKKYREFLISSAIMLSIYLVTNPFTFIFPIEFFQRVMEMRIKENGVVVDSYNPSPFKYLESITDQSSILVLILSLIMIFTKLKSKNLDFTIYIVLVNLIFFSMSSRLVDRWIIPILPILVIFTLELLSNFKLKILKTFIMIIISTEILLKFLVTNQELSQGSSIVSAYKFIKNNYSNEISNLLVISERGLHPIKGGNFRGSELLIQDFQFNLYETEGAFESFPTNFNDFEVVVFSSRVREYYSNPYIIKIQPNYYQKWEQFYRTLNDTNKYTRLNFGENSRKYTKQENIEIYRKINNE